MSSTTVEDSPSENASTTSATSFQPKDCTSSKAKISLPDELWMTVLESPCTFPPDIFSGIMLNLIKNPNVTSSHLFRADIFYDSDNDHTFDIGAHDMFESALVKHLKSDCRPRMYELPGYDLARTIVRQLVPRNPQLDKPLVQTCHFFSKLNDEAEYNVVLYVPHVHNAEEMPFYHPAVSHLAFVHTWQPLVEEDSDSNNPLGSISISYNLYPGTTLTTKLERTALRLLQTMHKHGQGQLSGYEKRVHLDQVIPQKRYQDTYARLKAKYGKQLAKQWVEVTDPGKHVFEDIGIAAFLIELWRDMYMISPTTDKPNAETGTTSKPPFPGFVDVGCGNGVLVYILIAEGYEGWGFDARERKTWSIFPKHVQERLRQRVLVPEVFQAVASAEPEYVWYDGVVKPGTFITSNHADELTAWTPLLAYLNQSSFIAIPCCSRDLSGARFRAPPSTKAAKEARVRLPQQTEPESKKLDAASNGQAAETGSLKRTEVQKKMPSAYSTLCSYVTSLAEDLGYETESEVLRIPSTRNQCIIGRKLKYPKTLAPSADGDERKQTVIDIVERELGKNLYDVSARWIECAQKLAQKPGSGH